MMGNGYYGGGWMWSFGGWMMLGTVALIGLIVFWVISIANRHQYVALAARSTANSDGARREQTRQLLDDRYARGELTTQEYTERLDTLGF